VRLRPNRGFLLGPAQQCHPPNSRSYLCAVASSLQVHGDSSRDALGDRSTVRKANVEHSLCRIVSATSGSESE
jgi:hypothetical protein